MNVILNPGQSNTRKGDINLPASVDLTGKENYLWKIVNSSGAPQFALPTATDDFAYYVGASGDIIGNNCAAEVPNTGENFRVVLKGTCVPGDELALADPTTAADAGKLRKRLTTTGTWRTLAIAEESGADGQLVLCRKVGERTTTV